MSRVIRFLLLTALYLTVAAPAFCDEADGSTADLKKAIHLKKLGTAGVSSAFRFRSGHSPVRLKSFNAASFDAGIADFNEAIQLKPDYRDAYQARSQAFEDRYDLVTHDQHDLDEAIADLTKAIRLDPQSLMGWDYGHRGRLRLRKGDFDGAIADSNECIRFTIGFTKWEPAQASCYSLRGSARQLKGDYDGAIADFTKSLQAASRYGGPAMEQEAQNNITGAMNAAQNAKNARLAMLAKSIENFQDDPVSDVPGVIMVGPNTLRYINSTLGPDVAFFTSLDHPITRLADITDPGSQFAAWGPGPGASIQDLETLKQMLGGGTPGLHIIGNGNFRRLFQDNPQLKLFVTFRGVGGVDAIESSGGGIRVRFVERPARYH